MVKSLIFTGVVWGVDAWRTVCAVNLLSKNAMGQAFCLPAGGQVKRPESPEAAHLQIYMLHEMVLNEYVLNW